MRSTSCDVECFNWIPEKVKQQLPVSPTDAPRWIKQKCYIYHSFACFSCEWKRYKNKIMLKREMNEMLTMKHWKYFNDVFTWVRQSGKCYQKTCQKCVSVSPCLHYTEQFFVPTRKAIRYSMDTYPICDLATQLRCVTEIAPKSSFICVNRGPIQYPVVVRAQKLSGIVSEQSLKLETVSVQKFWNLM